MVRLIYIALLCAFISGCAIATAQSPQAQDSASWNPTAVAIAVFGVITTLIAFAFRSREEILRSKLEAESKQISIQLAAINAKLGVITKMEIELSSLPVLAKKADDTAVKVSAIELDLARNYVTAGTMERVVSNAVAPIKDMMQKMFDNTAGKGFA